MKIKSAMDRYSEVPQRIKDCAENDGYQVEKMFRRFKSDYIGAALKSIDFTSFVDSDGLETYYADLTFLWKDIYGNKGETTITTDYFIDEMGVGGSDSIQDMVEHLLYNMDHGEHTIITYDSNSYNEFLDWE